MKTMKNREFVNSLKLNKNEQEIKLKKLQQAYENNEILEKEMTKKQKEDLLNLYKKQNRNIEQKIESKRKNIRKLLDSI